MLIAGGVARRSNVDTVTEGQSEQDRSSMCLVDQVNENEPTSSSLDDDAMALGRSNNPRKSGNPYRRLPLRALLCVDQY